MKKKDILQSLHPPGDSYVCQRGGSNPENPSFYNGLWEIGSTRRILLQLFREPGIGPRRCVEPMRVASSLLSSVFGRVSGSQAVHSA